MSKEIVKLPLIPLKGLVIFPYMVLHFDVGRKRSIEALEEAMIDKQEIFLSAQKNLNEDNPGIDEIEKTGTIFSIKQILKLPGDTVRVLGEGKKRGRIVDFEDNENYFSVNVEVLEDEIDTENNVKIEALLRSTQSKFEEYIKIIGNIPQDVALGLDSMEDVDRFADIISAYLLIKQEKKQEILECFKIEDRLEKILIILNDEIELLKLERKIGLKVKSKIDKNQKEYYLREQIKAMQEELGEDEDDKNEVNKYYEKIKKLKLPKEVKDKVMYELDRLKNVGSYSPEGGVIRTYVDWVLSVPWSQTTKENLDVINAREILEKEHYGLMDVKNRIIEYLAIKNYSKSLKGPILCLVGPPGVGKTSIGNSIAKAINRKFIRIPLGGVRDEAEIRGHRKTYIGAIPGRIVYALKDAKVKNPLIMFDEIDKISKDFRGDPADALLEVLDSEQNNKFRDHYLELNVDLSNVMFITTANTLDTIPRALLDRLEVIEVSGYTFEEKFNIAKKHLIPKIMNEYNVKEGTIEILDESIGIVVENYTRESGVRQLERELSSIIRKAITEILESEAETLIISSEYVKKYLGGAKYIKEKDVGESKVGVVNGLAWTSYGGDTLKVEINVMDGTGKLELTGQLGDVMKESARAGYTYVRSNAFKYGIDEEFYKNKDIHIHVPEGAVPKDGPSAGITITVGLISALSKKKVDSKVAMTGEITLTGRVLPIGGLKEKSLAAYRLGIKKVIIPKENELDLEKIPQSIKDEMEWILADNIDEVVKNSILGEI